MPACFAMQVASRRRKLSNLVSERDRVEEAFRVAAMEELGMEEELVMANIEKARSAYRGLNKLDDICEANKKLRFCEDEIERDEGKTPEQIVIREGHRQIICTMVSYHFCPSESITRIVLYTLCIDTSCIYSIARPCLQSIFCYLQRQRMAFSRLQREYPVGTSELIIARDKCEDDYLSKAVNEFGFTNEQADAKIQQARVKPHTAKMLNAIYDAHRKIEVRSNTIDRVYIISDFVVILIVVEANLLQCRVRE